MSDSDPLRPTLAVLCKLGSLAAHTKEMMNNRGHAFDLNAIQGLIADPDLNAWMEEMQKLALVPVPR
jgi:hypothetical protein